MCGVYVCVCVCVCVHVLDTYQVNNIFLPCLSTLCHYFPSQNKKFEDDFLGDERQPSKSYALSLLYSFLFREKNVF